MKNEIWKPVVGYEGYYEVSNYGTIRSLDRQITILKEGIAPQVFIKPGRRLSPGVVSGYLRVVLKHADFKLNLLVHRLVAIAFIPNPENKPQVNHIDGNKKNNTLQNLEWCTAKENTLHATQIGKRTNVGENNNKAKLSVQDILNIRNEFSVGKGKELSLKYGVSVTHIYRVAKNKGWKHVI